jgi:hypothetical protein
MSEKEKQGSETTSTKINDDTLLGTLQDDDFNKLKTGIENRVVQKIHTRIETAKDKIMADITGK